MPNPGLDSMSHGLPMLPSPIALPSGLDGSADVAAVGPPADGTVHGAPASARSDRSTRSGGSTPSDDSASAGGATPAGGPTPTPARPFVRPLRPGCYLIRWTPTPKTTYPDGSSLHYDGTLRVEMRDGDPVISGDLYIHPWTPWQVPAPTPTPPGVLPHTPGTGGAVAGGAVAGGAISGGAVSSSSGSSSALTSGGVTPPGVPPPTNGGPAAPPAGTRVEPDPSAGIPIFPIANYRHYLRGVRVVPTPEPLTRLVLVLDIHRWMPESRAWHADGLFSADLRWTPAPIGFPGTGDHLEGVLRDSAGTPVGDLSLGWVSPSLRAAVLEIDGVAAAESPDDNGAGLDWRAAMAEVGWDLKVVVSDRGVPEPNQTGAWSNTELHRELLVWRDEADHNRSWRYHLFCVRRLTATDRGIMYDAFAGDSNNIPREGAAIASHWMVPDTPKWGHARGRRVGEASAVYFRTAVHEIGHAMGLFHNTVDNGFMNTTDVIAASANSAQPFPDNVRWAFAPDDAHRLRHMPDISVRPGGVPFGQAYSSVPIVAADRMGDVPGMVLGVASLLDSVPLGAPVRIDLEMVNTCDVPREGPSTLSLKSGHVSGRVIDPSGAVRTFRPLVLCLEELPGARRYEPGESLVHSMTLLRGAQGALFPASGQYRVEVEVAWEIDGAEVMTRGQTNVMITPAENDAHAEAAKRILNTPDALLSLVLGGDYLPDGVAAIRICANDPVLGPHYAIVEAKRLAMDPDAPLHDIKTAMDLLDEQAVLSGSELKNAAEITEKAINTRGAIGKGRAVARRLKSRLDGATISVEAERVVKAL